MTTNGTGVRRIRPLRALIGAVAVLAALGLAGCTAGSAGSPAETAADSPAGNPSATQSGSLPEAGSLLDQASAAMRKVSSVRYTLALDSPLATTGVSAAAGTLTSEGDAVGTATLATGTAQDEVSYVLLGDACWVKVGDAGFQRFPRVAVAAVYDPAVLLDPQEGVPALLTAVQGAETRGRELASGVDAYLISATVPASALSDVLPGLADRDVIASMWIGVADQLLYQVTIDVPAGNGESAANSATLQLADHNAPVTIQPPA